MAPGGACLTFFNAPRGADAVGFGPMQNHLFSSLPGTARRRMLQALAAGGLTALVAGCGVPIVRRPAPTTPMPPLRRAAAEHIYQHNRNRIYPGMLPPMLYAIGVLEVSLTASGQVQRLNWMRAPTHAPEVMREIERTVRAAAPFPVPAGSRGALRFTDVWLWDKSGRFQLDTLTEGQRSE